MYPVAFLTMSMMYKCRMSIHDMLCDVCLAAMPTVPKATHALSCWCVPVFAACSGMDGAGDYTIGGQRVVADFDEFQVWCSLLSTQTYAFQHTHQDLITTENRDGARR